MPVVSTVTLTISGGGLRVVVARVGERALGADDRRLGLQQVLRGLDQDGVDAAVEHAGDLLLVGVAQRRERDVAQRRQLGARTDRARAPSAAGRRGRGVGAVAGELRAGLGELADPVADVVLAKVGVVGAERVRADAVRPDLEVGVVDRADHVGTGDVEDLVATLEPLEVVQAQVVLLEHRAHRPVGDHDAFGESAAQSLGLSGHGVLGMLLGTSSARDGCRCADPA